MSAVQSINCLTPHLLATILWRRLYQGWAKHRVTGGPIFRILKSSGPERRKRK